MAVEQRLATEIHYTVGQIAAIWGWSEQTVRRVFDGEPGVLRLGGITPLRGKRQYVTLTIPASVAARVHARHSGSGEVRELGDSGVHAGLKRGNKRGVMPLGRSQAGVTEQ